MLLPKGQHVGQNGSPVRGARATVALLVASLCVGTACTAPRQSGSTSDGVIVGFGDSLVYGSNYPKPWLYTLLHRLTGGPITYVPEWPWDWDAPALAMAVGTNQAACASTTAASTETQPRSCALGSKRTSRR